VTDIDTNPSFVLVITGRGPIPDKLINVISDTIGEYYSYIPKAIRLGDIAVEYGIPSHDHSLLYLMNKRFSGSEFDFNIVENLNRKKKLFIADMDSTLIANECIDELAAYAGLRDEISIITERAMEGKINFDDSLIQRVALLKGLPEATLESIYNQNITLNPGALILGKTLASHGVKTIIASGGFDFVAIRVAKSIGFVSAYSNRLEIENSVLTGRVLPPILSPKAKRNILIDQCEKANILLSETLCVGDGANDIEMINMAGNGVAYCAKNELIKVAECTISHADLTGLLYLQGYRQEDFSGC